ncbi:unnamed protein product [Symbiodinium necroappetens]|uniref:TIR domain-containing protein n=1 Tax=Symbiodinium necroappetens TaxID=1628268 RepID=A0A812J237_9DINO|nr:unnamed protein product [Symbiodinium necroappetens]
MTQTATTTVSVSMNQTATTTASMTQTTAAEANQSKTEISGTSQAAAVTSTISQTRTRTISSTTSPTQTSTQPRAAAAEPMANTEVTEVPWLALLCFLAGFAVLVAVLGFLWRRWKKKPGREVLDVREPGDQDTQTDLEVQQKSLFESVAPGAAPPQSSNGSGTGCQVAGETSMQVLEVRPGDQDTEKILLGSAAPPEDQTQDAKSQEQASMHTVLGVEPDDQDIDLEVSGSAVLHDPRQDSREVLEADQLEPQLRDSVSSSWWCWCGVEAPEPIVPDSSLKLARDRERSLSEAVLSVEKRTRTLSSTSSLQAPCREEEAPRIAMISARFNDKNKKTEMKFREVCDTLRQRQLEVLMVEAGGGEDFGTLTAMYLGKLKKKKGIMLAVCTPDYGERTSSPYCTYAELKFAMDHGIDILPLKVDSVYPPSPPCEDGVASGLVQMAMPDNKVYIDCVGKSVDDIAAKIEEKLRSSKARGRSGHG